MPRPPAARAAKADRLEIRFENRHAVIQGRHPGIDGVDRFVIADADVGYGSLINVRRAMRELEAAGASAVQLEDQVSPKKCGHELGRAIVAVDEMEQRLGAAVDGRQNDDTLIIARTDARTTHGLAEAIRRGRAYARAGADVIFVESPESEAELREVTAGIPAPTLANMIPNFIAPPLGRWREA